MLQKVIAALLAMTLSATGFAVRDEIRDQQWHLNFLDIDRAHETSTGAGVIVGIIDTGVDAGHPDLAGRVLPGADFSVIAGPDGWEDREGHGTAMAGIIAANGRALGIAPDATILPVRRAVYHAGVDIGSADAIEWAVDHGASVLCLAFGGPGEVRDLQVAVERAIAHDVVVVASVGNFPDEAGYPVSYPGVLGAAGVVRSGEHAQVSVVTPVADLAAPAVEIMSPWSRAVSPDGYGVGTGTSASTAIIAGVAALVRARFPDLSADEVIRRMTATAVDRGAAGRDDEYGYGVVDPVAALTADVPPPTPTPTAVDAAPPGTLTRTLFLTAAALGVAVLLITGLVLGLRRSNHGG